jgi:hemolysin III
MLVRHERRAQVCPAPIDVDYDAERFVRSDANMTAPLYRPGEMIVDRYLHWTGIGLGPIAVMALIWLARHRDGTIMISVVIYGASLLAMLGCSALYHLSGVARRKALFRRLDHAAIFFLIAGTYTPFALNTIGGAWGVGLFAFVWAVASLGIVFKLLRPSVLEGASIVAYLLLGWSVLAVLDPLLSAVSSRTLALLALGGLLYTVGVLFHVWNRLPYQNAIWHAFVLAGASCHYAAIVNEVAA